MLSSKKTARELANNQSQAYWVQDVKNDVLRNKAIGEAVFLQRRRRRLQLRRPKKKQMQQQCKLQPKGASWNIIIILALLKMRFRQRDQASYRSYQRISLGKRQRLVQMVNQEGLSLSKVSKKLKLKLTTARLILKKYNETGSFPMRKFKKKIPKVENKLPLGEVKMEHIEEELSVKQVGTQESNQVKREEQGVVRGYLPNGMTVFTFLNPLWPPQFINWGM